MSSRTDWTLSGRVRFFLCRPRAGGSYSAARVGVLGSAGSGALRLDNGSACVARTFAIKSARSGAEHGNGRDPRTLEMIVTRIATMSGRLFNNTTFQKAWLIATALVGVFAIVVGGFQISRSGGAAGIIGGAVMLSIRVAGLRALQRRSLSTLPNAHR
jgi:hypothetical protein